MYTRRNFAALAFAGATGLAGCTSGLAGNPDDSDDGNGSLESTGSTIVVAGEGAVESEPDVANLRLEVTGSGDDPETVRDELAVDVEAVRKALVEYGLDDEQLTTDRFSIDENWRAEREPEADHDEYVGVHRLLVDLDDPGDVEDVIDVAVDSGPVQVDRVTFGLSDERRDELREAALEAATEDARTEAEVIAASEGLQIDAVERIVTDRVDVDVVRASVTDGTGPHGTPTPEADSSPGSDTVVQADDVTVTASVEVVYRASST